jgi:thioredoxin 1
MSTLKVISDSEFATEVMGGDQPVLVYFWAAWCGPCRLMATSVTAVAASYGDRLKIVKMEIDPNPISVAQWKVEGVPAFRLFQAGELKGECEGAISKVKLEAFIDTYLPS